MKITPATDRRGNALIETATATHDDLREAARATPCPLALVVVERRATGEVLFGFNRWRQEYELPGGMIDAGETFARGAARELEEETGIRIRSLELVGYARYALVDPTREELGAVYLGRIGGEQAQPTEELSSFVWRKPLSPSGLRLSALDDAVAAWATTRDV